MLMPSARNTFIEVGAKTLVPIVDQVLDLIDLFSLASLRFRAIWGHQAAFAAPSVTRR